MNNIIESMDNTKIKEIRSLHKKKFREKLKKYIIEGKRIVEEAMIHEVDVEKIIITKDALHNIEKQDPNFCKLMINFDLMTVSEKVFRSIAKTETPQGIMAVVHKRIFTVEQGLKVLPNKPFIITLERIQDPGNMGTIIRTAEAAGADLILVTKDCTDPYGDKSLRSSMGAIFLIPIIEVDGLDWINLLKKRRIQFIAADLSAKKSYLDFNYKGGINIIIGNEGQGISKSLLDKTDERIIIPIYGSVESLNASIAAGIMIYKAQEMRKQK